MIVGYWHRGENCTQSHVISGLGIQERSRPVCGTTIAGDRTLQTIDGGYPFLECRRCLRMERKRHRDLVGVCSDRLNGKHAAQRDAFE